VIDRALVAGVAAEAISLADELAEHMTTRFKVATEPPHGELISSLVGLRARNTLRAIRLLLDETVDDQVAVLGRTLAEAVIDLEYLRVPTERILGKTRRILLRTTDKEELFLTSNILAEERITGRVASIPPEELERAKALRRHLGLPAGSPYWHAGRGTKSILDELQAVVTGSVERGTLEYTYHFFQMFSLSTHTSPNHACYFDEAVGGGWPWTVRQGFVSDDMVAGSVLLGTHVVRLWGDGVDHDVTPQALDLVRQLTPSDEDEESDG
jgi:hypothetical protein